MRVTSVTSWWECDGWTLNFPMLLRYILALVVASRAVKLTGELETIVFKIIRDDPVLTVIPFGAWLSLEKSTASCPMLLVTFSITKYFLSFPSDPRKQNSVSIHVKNIAKHSHVVPVFMLQTKLLAPVVQKLDSPTHRINHYPVDKY